MTVDELIDNFSIFDNWEDRYSYLIDLGRKLPNLEDKFKTDEWKVSGCQSQVWLVPEIQEGKLYIKVDSDAFIVRGLVNIITIIYNGKTLEEIKNIDINDILNKLGLTSYISTSLRNGLFSMINKINLYIKGYNEQ